MLNFSDYDIDNEYPGGYGDEEISREIIAAKEQRINNTEG